MGGNIFKNKATSIPKHRIEPTIRAYMQKLAEIFPTKAQSLTSFEPVGSVGKKEVSGDIDLAIDWTQIVESFTGSEIEKWGIEWDDWNDLYTQIHKRSRTATYYMSKMRALLTLISKKMSEHNIDTGDRVTAGNIFTCFPQYDKSGPTNDYVQIDWMVGNIDWLRWSYYSHGERNLKGLHRTQFIVALFSEIGYTFNHFSGIKKQNTSEWIITSPKDALDMLSKHYGHISLEDTLTFAKLHSWLLKSKNESYVSVILRYRNILTKQKATLPNVLQHTI
jgi:hypothetical protein